MEQLEYFNVPEPAAFRRRTGRIVAAGVILLLAALPPGVLAALLLFQLFNLYLPLEARFGLVSLAAALATAAGFLLTLGVGGLLRRRWFRPLALAVAGLWLTAGSIVFTLLLVLYAIRMWRRWLGLWSASLLEQALSFAALAMLCVACPLTLWLLLRSADVRRTLEVIDLRPRWTDTWPIGRMAFLLTQACLAITFGWIGADPFNSDWRMDEPWLAVIISQVMPFALGAIVGPLRYYRAAWWAGGCAAALVVATCVWTSKQSLNVERLTDEDNFFVIAMDAMAAALVVFLIIVRPRRVVPIDAEPILQ